MNPTERLQYIKQLLWDYNYSPEEAEEVLLGSKQKAGHLNKEMIIQRIIESYPWFTVIQLLTLEELNTFLQKFQINRLRSKSLQNQYAFVRDRLQKHVPPTETISGLA